MSTETTPKANEYKVVYAATVAESDGTYKVDVGRFVFTKIGKSFLFMPHGQFEGRSPEELANPHNWERIADADGADFRSAKKAMARAEFETTEKAAVFNLLRGLNDERAELRAAIKELDAQRTFVRNYRKEHYPKAPAAPKAEQANQ